MNQDNPFAKGLSINQDMLTDEWQHAIDSGRVTIVSHYAEVLQKAINGISKITVMPYDPTVTIDPLNADLFANHPTLNADIGKCFEPTRVVFIPLCPDKRRQLLALGREEE